MYGYIYRPLDGGTWSSAKESWKINDAEIIKAIACAHPKFYIGTRAGKTTRYAVLDIDANSKYHNQYELKRLLAVLEQVGLSHSSLFRSSYSEGWHLYLFFDEPINSVDLRRQLVKLLTLQDFDIAKGTLEIFPHPGTNSRGMGLRLPLQPGWAWLDKHDLEVIHDRLEMTPTKALEFFLDALESDANTVDDFKSVKKIVAKLESSLQSKLVPSLPSTNVIPMRTRPDLAPSEFSTFVSSVFQHLPSGIIADSWYRGRQFYIEGLSGPSQRAESIFCLGHYFFYGDPSRELPAMGYGYEEEREWAIMQFLDAHHNGHSEDINKGRSDAGAQITRAAHWLPEHKKTQNQQPFVLEQPSSWKPANAKRRKEARTRIKEALDGLKNRNRTFTTVELEEAAQCSRRTLYSHKDIWRQDYEDLAADFFAICTGEYNAVVDFDSAVSVVSTSEDLCFDSVAAVAAVSDFIFSSELEISTPQKLACVASGLVENDWHTKVAALLKFLPSELPVSRLKSHIFVLLNYASLAPCENDSWLLLSYVLSLREELHSRFKGPGHPS